MKKILNNTASMTIGFVIGFFVASAAYLWAFGPNDETDRRLIEAEDAEKRIEARMKQEQDRLTKSIDQYTECQTKMH